MPYKVHKLPNGKFKAFRQVEGDRPARPLSKHPQSKETADKQIAAIKIHEHGEPETHSSMSMGCYSFSKGSSGKFKVSKKPNSLEMMHGPKNEPRGSNGKWTKSKSKVPSHVE